MNKGWISLHRKIQDNPLWKAEPFTKGQAWVDLLLLANHEPGFFYVRGNKINVGRGQVGWSQKRLSDRWQWSRSKVRKFLKDLEKEQQIRQHKNAVSTIITIENYDKYQQEKQQKEQQRDSRRTAEEQQRDTNNNDNNYNNENKSSSRTRVFGVPVPDALSEINGFINRYESYWAYLKDTHKLRPSIYQVEANFRSLIELKEKGNDPLKVIDQTINAGNKSFYPLKEDYGGKDKPDSELTEGEWRRKNGLRAHTKIHYN